MVRTKKSVVAEIANGGNRRRIIDAALEMCNALGERNVSTNHICARLAISPGNLYYHFRNKQAIIFELYLQLEEELLGILKLPSGRQIELNDIFVYVDSLFRHVHKYRFFFRDLAWMVESTPELRQRYPELTRRVLASGQAIYSDLDRAGIMRASAREIETLTVNSWMVLTYWLTYERIHRSDVAKADEIMQGIRQFVALFYPYLTAEAKDFTDQLMKTRWATTP